MRRSKSKNSLSSLSTFKMTEQDIYLFNEGTHLRIHEKMGSHVCEHQGKKGVYFAVWAPNAREVHVIGNFNAWNRSSHPMQAIATSGIWEAFVPEAQVGNQYKYYIQSHHKNYKVEKADPLAFSFETPPKTASIISDLPQPLPHDEWMEMRKYANALSSPISIYEVHLGSWKKKGKNKDEFLTYRELAKELPAYVKRIGFTHVEIMPIMEHPFYGSWGYQVTGFFAPTSRYGTPEEFMALIHEFHRQGIGVILDWVPSHFPNDEHGLGYFDGTHLYEHEDPRKGFHPDWKSFIFNYGRNEVRSFLLSSAFYWLDRYQLDGLRVDGVASMLYLNYSRKDGEWIPNKHGGKENLEAVSFLRQFNESVYREFPLVQTIAEESTSWPNVSGPTYIGGLGFGMKWDMGWMHDTLSYMQKDPVFRKHYHNEISFRIVYAFFEKFILSLSHDEVVHGKASLLNKMPGDLWQKHANLRLLFSLMFAQPGKKLLFMGQEFGQPKEWNHDKQLNWDILSRKPHQGLHQCLRDLNHLYRKEKALFESDFSSEKFEWIIIHDSEQSIFSWLRKGEKTEDTILFVGNFTPVPRENYRIGIPYPGAWKEIFNSDAQDYGGSGVGNLGQVETKELESHGKKFSLVLSLPPLGALMLKAPEVPYE